MSKKKNATNIQNDIIESNFLKQHPELKDLSKEELIGAIEGYNLEREEEKEIKLKDHLEMFSDAIIAIAITIMVLEIPIPEKASDYHLFIKDIGIFLISFFIVADFWLDHHRVVNDSKKVNERILVLDFLFLANLCLIPLFTKWIMLEPTSFVVVNFGVIMITGRILLQIISHLLLLKKVNDDKSLKHFMQRMTLARLFVTVIINLLIMLFAYYHPNIGHWWFVLIPVLSFGTALFKVNPRIIKNSKRNKKRTKKSNT
ncbi:MAG: TMEM175 family protein [Bacilli bacterium]|nr:TMEM175 family protein [Bacilli bacterium]